MAVVSKKTVPVQSQATQPIKGVNKSGVGRKAKK